MSFLKNVLDNVLGRSETQRKPDAEVERRKAQAPPNVVFDASIPVEAALTALWREYEQGVVTQSKSAREALQRFYGSFVHTYKDWQPSNTSVTHGIGRMPKGQVAGCSFGHPTAVLTAAVRSLDQIPNDFASVARREHASADELHAAVSLDVLKAVTIAMRSHHNRTVLLGIGLIPSLFRLIKLVISRLNTLTAIIAIRERLLHVATQLSFLQHLLLHVMAVLDAYLLHALPHACQSPVITLIPYLQKNAAALCCHDAAEPGSADSRVMEEVVKPLLVEGAVPLILELLKLVRTVKDRGAGAVDRCDESLALLLLRLLCASRKAQESLLGVEGQSTSGLQVIMSLLAGPGQDVTREAASSPADLSEQSSASVQHNSRLHILHLQALLAAVKHTPGNLETAERAGMGQRITQLLQRLALTCTADSQAQSGDAAAALAERRLSGMQASTSALREGSGFDLHAAESQATRQLLAASQSGADLPMPECPPLSAAFAVLEGALGLKQPKWAEAQRQQHWHRLMQCLSEAAIATLVPPDTAPADDVQQAVRRLTHRPGALQHHVLQYTSHLLSAMPSAIHFLRQTGLWEMAFGPAYFFLQAAAPDHQAAPAQPTQQQPEVRVTLRLDAQAHVSVQLSLADDQALSASSRASPEQRGCRGNTAALDQLRVRVVQLAEQAACLQGIPDNEPECCQLLGLLEHCLDEDDVILLAAPALARVLSSKPEVSVETLERCTALSTLAHAIRGQAEGAGGSPGSQVNLQGMAQKQQSAQQSELSSSSSREGDMHWQARFAVLSLLATFLRLSPGVQRRAVREWDIVKALFALVGEPDMQQAALRMVSSLMRIDLTTNASEDDVQGKRTLFIKYVQSLPCWLEARTFDQQSLALVCELLAGIREVTQVNSYIHQNLFREAEVFVQIVNLLNLDYPSDVGEHLCAEVLATLAALLRDNEANRHRLKADVGYDTLQHVVLSRSSTDGPSKAVLLQVLCLALEANYHDESSGYTAVNGEAAMLFFSLLIRAQYSVQHWGLQQWMRLLKGSMANLAACERAGVNALLIRWYKLAKERPDLQSRILRLIQVTGAYSISGRDLRAMLTLLRRDDSGCWPPKAQELLQTLTVMAQHEDPSAFFSFADDSAGILRSTGLPFPGSKGYTFAVWLRLETVQKGLAAGGRSLYSLLVRSRDGSVKGIAAAFKGSTLAVRALLPRPFELDLKHKFEARRWYHVVITHSPGGALSPAAVSLFVDGAPEAHAKFRFPKVQEALNACSIGASIPKQDSGINLPVGAFQGQMGCIYLFDDIISAAQVKALHALGPDYQATFLPSEFDAGLEQAPASHALLVEGRDGLAAKLAMSYNAQAAAGRMLYDTSDMDKGGPEDGDTAALAEGTQLCRTTQLRDMLHCLGGVAALLPLLSQLDAPLAEGEESAEPGSLAVDTVELLSAVLAQSPSNRRSMQQISGMAVMAHLLQEASPVHLSTQLLAALQQLHRAVQPVPGLGQAVRQHLLLNLRLWSRAPADSQAQLFSLLKHLAEGDAGGLLQGDPSALLAILRVPTLLDAMRSNYLTAEAASIAPSMVGPAEVQELRRQLMGFVGTVLAVQTSPGLLPELTLDGEDIEALLAYVGDGPDMETSEAVLSGLADVLHRPTVQRALASHIHSYGGPCLFASLLQREQPSLRIIGLQIWSALVANPHSGDESKAAADAQALWATAHEALMMFPLTEPLRRALLLLMCSAPAAQGSARSVAADVITCPAVAGILLRLLLGCDDAGERLATLQALQDLIVEGPDDNRAALITQLGWEEWLLEPLLDGGVCAAAGRTASPNQPMQASLGRHLPWRWQGLEMQLLRRMLSTLLVFCVTRVQHGWEALDQAAAHIRRHTDRGVLDGWGLMHELLADVLEATGAYVRTETQAVAAAAGDTWTVVPLLATPHFHTNVHGLMSITYELLSGSLVAPSAGGQLQPSEAAEAWAQRGSGPGIAAAAWSALGCPDTPDLEPQASEAGQRLSDAAWSFLEALRRAQGAMSSMQPSRESDAGSPRMSEDLSEGPALAGQDGIRLRLAACLLLHSMRCSPIPAAQQHCSAFMHSLRFLCDCSAPALREQVQLLLSGLYRLAQQQDRRDASQRRAAIAQAITGIMEHLPSGSAALGPALPLESDPSFWPEVEKRLDGAAAAGAARMKLAVQRSLAARHQATAQRLEAAGNDRHKEDRRLRLAFSQAAKDKLGLICTADRTRRAEVRAAQEEEAALLARAWRNILRSLTHDRGLWSAPDQHDPSRHRWKLDRQEDPSRRRVRLKRNYKFQMYSDPVKGAAAAQQSKADDDQKLALPGVKRKSMEETEEGGEHAPSPERPGSPPDVHRSMSAGHGDDEDSTTGLHEQEQVRYSCSCQLVTPRRIVSGSLTVTNLQIRFFGEADDMHDQGSKASMVHRRWAIADVKELHHARFLLRPSALEIFMLDRSNALLNFPTNKVMREVGDAVHAVAKRVAVYDRKRKQDEALRLQALWQRWELSNFDYLMKLNTLAGRSYNDLNQYPVFPWVIADYSSSSLDLNQASSYRDLSKPVGALDSKRLQFFKERYEAFADPDIPAFHYGSHYSSAGVVLFYLIRTEPFTSLNRQLQGGRFDHADRLFHDLAATWDNCLHSTSDVKELIPEFFYQPEFLLNSNAFHLGTRQDGNALGDVKLPPWANGSPDEFVRMQREALEGEHVSQHLHAWLDLIFGVQQRGSRAKDACNVFYYLTYEGAADLDDIADPMQRKAVEDQISHFGQTPSQLFRRAHGKRGHPPSPALRPLLNCPEAMRVTPLNTAQAKRPNVSVAALKTVESRLVAVSADRAVACHRYLTPREGPALTFSGVGDQGVTLEPDSYPPRLLGTPFAADLDSSQCYGVLAGGQAIVSCGFWDNSIRCYAVDDGRLLQTLRQHKDIVTCIAVAGNGTSLVSGSRDTTLIVWEAVVGWRQARSLMRGPAIPMLPLKQRPRHLLYGHEDAVVCAVICAELDLIVSASANGAVLMHSLGQGRYIRYLHLPNRVAVRTLAVAAGPAVLLAHSWGDLALHALSVNGRPLVSMEGTERLHALACSPDGRMCVTGGAKGTITLRWLHSLQVIMRWEGMGMPVTALTLTLEECIIAGTSRGALLLYTPDPRRRITRRLHQTDVRGSSSASPSRS